jgi:hypothetical protein
MTIARFPSQKRGKLPLRGITVNGGRGRDATEKSNNA